MIGWFIKNATESIGTPALTKYNHVEAVVGVIPNSITHGPAAISTIPSITCPSMSDI